MAIFDIFIEGHIQLLHFSGFFISLGFESASIVSRRRRYSDGKY